MGRPEQPRRKGGRLVDIHSQRRRTGFSLAPACCRGCNGQEHPGAQGAGDLMPIAERPMVPQVDVERRPLSAYTELVEVSP